MSRTSLEVPNVASCAWSVRRSSDAPCSETAERRTTAAPACARSDASIASRSKAPSVACVSQEKVRGPTPPPLLSEASSVS